jgi:hypothetical protein
MVGAGLVIIGDKGEMGHWIRCGGSGVVGEGGERAVFSKIKH